jgi:hypothetical protein
MDILEISRAGGSKAFYPAVLTVGGMRGNLNPEAQDDFMNENVIASGTKGNGLLEALVMKTYIYMTDAGTSPARQGLV